MILQKNYQEEIVFLQLKLSRLGDKRGVSADEVEVDADKDLVKIRKVIFKSPRFDRIRSFDGGVRKYIRGICFPFETGVHITGLKTAERVNDRLQFFLEDRQILIDEFAEIYPELILEAEPKLRKLFNAGEYDPVEQIRESFRMTWNFWMISTPKSLDSISTEVFKEERNKMARRMEEAFEEARHILRESCITLISTLRTSLEPDMYGGSKRFSASTLRNLQDFLENFSIRDITNDTQLQTYIHEAKKPCVWSRCRSITHY